jgi:hypothetical protein
MARDQLGVRMMEMCWACWNLECVVKLDECKIIAPKKMLSGARPGCGLAYTSLTARVKRTSGHQNPLIK